MKDRFLIAIDLDGTLLKDDKTISERTKKVMNQVQKEGHLVMISTGRPYRSSAGYYKELDLKTPIVNYNGAFIHHPLEENWGSYHEPMDIRTVFDIVNTCDQFSTYNIIAEVLDNVYMHFHDERILDVFQMGNPNIVTGDLRSYLKKSPTSMIIYAEEDNLKDIRSYLEEVHGEQIEQRTWAVPWSVIEINKKGINKALGVKKVADYYGISRNHIIAFGDEDNDLEMLEFAKYGVAMENGIKEVKEVADHITLSNEEDGVAVFLEKLLLS